MKRFFSIIVIINLLFAGGLVHNTNQSADFIRTMNRNASTDLDATYFNPAGLTMLNDGFHLYVSNQTISQTRTVEADFPTLNEDTYIGETFVPAFPNIYLAKISGNLAFSAGFMPIGGGGSAEFPDGLPSFEYILAQIVQLQPTISGYALSSSFVGSSIYLGFQGNVSYRINDLISVGVGGRYISANNTYDGSLEGAALIALDGTVLTNAENPAIPPDMLVESERSGSAFTPVLSLFVKPFSMLELAVRYEPQTEMTMLSNTTTDDTKGVISNEGMFPHDTEYDASIPAQLSTGFNIIPSDLGFVSVSFNYYFNNSIDYWQTSNGFRTAKDGIEFGTAANYNYSESLKLSFGYLKAIGGANESYNSDISNSLNSNTLGLGCKYIFSDKTAISLGVSNTFYQEAVNAKEGQPFEERYMKTALDFAIALSHSF